MDGSTVEVLHEILKELKAIRILLQSPTYTLDVSEKQTCVTDYSSYGNLNFRYE